MKGRWGCLLVLRDGLRLGFNFHYLLGFWRWAGERLLILQPLSAQWFQWGWKVLILLDSCSKFWHQLSNTTWELYIWKGQSVLILTRGPPHIAEMVNPVTAPCCAAGAPGFRAEPCCPSVPAGDTLGQLAAEKKFSWEHPSVWQWKWGRFFFFLVRKS